MISYSKTDRLEELSDGSESSNTGRLNMPLQSQDFGALLQGIRDGSNAAYEQLIALYGDHVVRVVRRKLAPAMRSLFDSADFVQSIWAVSIKNRERLANCRNAYELINLLTKVAGDRMIDERRRRLILERQNLNREVPLAQLPGSRSLRQPGATGSEVAIAKECLQQLVHQQVTQVRLMVQMRLEGATHEEIADALGVNTKSVQRALRRLERQVPQ